MCCVESIEVIGGGEVAIHLVGAVDAGCNLGEVEYIQGAVILIISLRCRGTVAIIADCNSTYRLNLNSPSPNENPCACSFSTTSKTPLSFHSPSSM